MPVNFSIFTSPVCAILPFASFELGISMVKTFAFPHLQSPFSSGSYQAPSHSLTTPCMISSLIITPAKTSPRLLKTLTTSPFLTPSFLHLWYLSKSALYLLSHKYLLNLCGKAENASDLLDGS